VATTSAIVFARPHIRTATLTDAEPLAALAERTQFQTDEHQVFRLGSDHQTDLIMARSVPKAV
jgi:hypothetical protein